MARKRTRRVVAAKFNQRQMNLFDQDFGSAIRAALDPDQSVLIRGRSWRISQPEELSNGSFLYGQLGYGFRAERSAALYNEDEHRFEESVEEEDDARYCYYLLHVPTRVIVFEERQPEIKWKHVLRVMSDIVEKKGFELDPLVDQRSFRAWLEEVDAVLTFDAHMLRPNPRYKEDEDEIRSLIDDPNSGEVNLKAKARDETSGLKVLDTVLEKAISFISRGNGTFAAKATKGGSKSHFKSNERIMSKTYEVAPEEDTGKGRIEMLHDAIRNLVADVKDELRGDDEGKLPSE